MTIQHSVITDPNIHEPKGVAAAGNGEVYVANGAGSGSWRALSEFSGAMTITNNASAQAITAAATGDLSDFADYVQIVNFATGELDKITYASNALTVPNNGGGLYLVNFYCTIASDTNNTNVAVKFAINGASGLARRPRSLLFAINSYYNLSATGLVRLANNDVVTMYIASDKTANLTLQDAAFLLHRVGE